MRNITAKVSIVGNFIKVLLREQYLVTHANIVQWVAAKYWQRGCESSWWMRLLVWRWMVGQRIMRLFIQSPVLDECKELLSVVRDEGVVTGVDLEHFNHNVYELLQWRFCTANDRWDTPCVSEAAGTLPEVLGQWHGFHGNYVLPVHWWLYCQRTGERVYLGYK